jgi:hypothetical protein
MRRVSWRHAAITAATVSLAAGLAWGGDIRIDEYDLNNQLISTRTVSPGTPITLDLGAQPLTELRTFMI